MSHLQVSFYGQQYEFVNSDAKFALLRGGIGSGKSIGGAGRAIAAAFGHIGGRAITSPNIGVVTAPTYGQLRDATLRTFLEVAGDLVVSHTKSPPINVVLRNGSEILFRSADQPDNLRGPNVSWWWGDEAAYYHKDVWRVMIGRLRQFGRQGFAWITTTPKGRNYLWQEFVQKNHDNPDYATYKVRTGENPFIELDYFLTLAGAYAGDFALQELEGDFVAFEGLIYSRFDYDTHTFGQPSVNFKYYICAVDWGFVHPGVIGVFGVDYDDRLWMVHEEYHKRVNIDDWVEIGKQVQGDYKPKVWYCDPSEPTYIQKFKSAGMKATEANNEVRPGIQRVDSRLVRREDGLPRLMVARNARYSLTEFEQYKWMESRDGLKEEPLKANDHAMDVIRYAVNAMDAKQRGQKMVARAQEY